MDQHADRRDAKRNKRRYGMRVVNRAAHLHQYLINQRAQQERAKKEQQQHG
jgi:hypothetical protein